MQSFQSYPHCRLILRSEEEEEEVPLFFVGSYSSNDDSDDNHYNTVKYQQDKKDDDPFKATYESNKEEDDKKEEEEEKENIVDKIEQEEKDWLVKRVPRRIHDLYNQRNKAEHEPGKRWKRDEIGKYYDPNKIAVVKGGPLDEKIGSCESFWDEDGAQFLLSTSAGGEGINLQVCSILFNYDLPWNPMAVEQRIGRIHRYGQTETVQVYNLVAEETIEEKVYAILEKKLLEDKGYIPYSFDVDPIEGVDMLADAHQIPFADESFDLITSFEVLEHLQEPWKAVAEISRLLKPGGLFVGSVAFLKPFHNSYFHMTHWGVASLFNKVGLVPQKFYGVQNPFAHVTGKLAPFGPRSLSEIPARS